MGATPDGILSCKCCDKICIEIKCRYSIREKKVMDAWKETDFLENVSGEIQLKKSHRYYSQVIGQMAITGIKSFFFVVWTTNGSPLVQKIPFNPEHWLQILPNLNTFFK